MLLVDLMDFLLCREGQIRGPVKTCDDIDSEDPITWECAGRKDAGF